MAKDPIANNLKQIEKLTVKLRNKMKRVDLDYTVQASVSSVDPTQVRYALQITAPANGLAPVTFVTKGNETVEQFMERVKVAVKNIDMTAIEIAYHEAQIEACKRTIETHEERIEELKNPKPEEDEAQEEVEVAEGEESVS